MYADRPMHSQEQLGAHSAFRREMHLSIESSDLASHALKTIQNVNSMLYIASDATFSGTFKLGSFCSHVSERWKGKEREGGESR